jgi:D-glycerate 3-kinase
MTSDTTQLSNAFMRDFLSRHRLPAIFEKTARQYYLPLAAKLPSLRPDDQTFLLGINGAQGTGKSTLADFLAKGAEELFGWRTAVLSIDDFYLTRAERQVLARDVHPLFATRGVPGTHDMTMLSNVLDQLENLPAGAAISLPRFDKSTDERAKESTWPTVDGPLDMVVLEGWCVGSEAQKDDAIREPVNELERDEDPGGSWRTTANEKLATLYEPVFARLDALVFLAAPSFDAVFRWRLEQEQKLADATGGSAIMDESEVARFIRFYERITRHNLRILPERADIVLTLDENHAVVASRGRLAGI